MAKTKTLISFVVTAKLICVFVFAYAKSRFSHDEAHLIKPEIINHKSHLFCTLTHLFFSDLNPDNRPLDGCRVHGSLDLNKVAGNFHITAGK